MEQFNEILNTFFFILLPYLSIFTFFLVSIYRYKKEKFGYSSLSSQFLENKQHFWGLVPFHYGIILILTAHLFWFLFPGTVLVWNNVPLRLYIMEISALLFGLLTIIGLINIFIRRFSDKKVKTVTSPFDWITLIILTTQVVSGLYVAFFFRYGSSWFATSMTPYLLSVLKFSPDLSYINAMPFMVKFHIVNAFTIVLLFPFTRLVHALVLPLPYIIRKFQIVRWNWDRKKTRNAENKSV